MKTPPSVKHKRIQDKKMECKFCTGRDFELFQGFFYCTSCGTENQQQDFVYERFQDSDSNEEEDYPDTESSGSSAENSENEELKKGDENVDTSTLSDTNENFNGEENDQNIQSAP